jgi:hypothetical protein
MRKAIPIASALLIVTGFTSFLGVYASQRIVLGEFFTNTG